MYKVNRKETFISAFSGFVLNSVGFVGMGLAMLAFAPQCYGTTLPILGVVESINAPLVLMICYYVFVLVAVISSLNSWLYSQMLRFAPKLTMVKSERGRNAFVGAIVIGLSCVLSSFGVTAIINTGYSYVSTISLLTTAIPLLVVAPIKLYLWNRNLGSKK